MGVDAWQRDFKLVGTVANLYLKRLIDADALIEFMLERKQPLLGADNSKDRYRYMQWLADFNAIRDAKTII